MPAPSDLAVVVSFFNHHNFDAPLRNLRRFCRHMAQTGVALYGMELRSPGRASEVLNLYGNWTSTQGNNRTMLWQKEAMWNYLASRLPKNFTKVLGCDTDLWFDNPNFLQDTSAALDTHKVVMPWSKAIWTDPRGAEIRDRVDAVTAHKANGKYWEGHQGFAIAFQRELWDKNIGMYPWGVLGAGDTFLMSALTDSVQSRDFLTRALGGAEMLKVFDTWAKKVRDWGGDSMTSIPGAVYHEYHGSRENRQLVTRHDRLAGMLPTELCTRADGLISWTDNALLRRMYEVYQYFFERKDDE